MRPGFRGQGYPVTNVITANQVLDGTVSSEQGAWRCYVIEVTPIVMLYLALAFYRLDNQSFWTDEAFSVNQRFLAGPIWTDLNRISPLYFILLGLWSKLVGTTEFALRTLSIFSGLVAVCITYFIGYRLFDRRTAVLGAILLASSPYFIWYAQEVRYIALVLMTSLVMSYSFHRAISCGSWKWWLSYGATSLLALFSLVTIVLLVAAHGLFILCRASYRPMLRKFMACQVPALLLFAIWFGFRSGALNLIAVLTKAPTVTLHDPTRSRESLPASDVAGMIPYTLYAFSAGFSLGPSLRELHISRSISTLVSHAPILTTVGVLFAMMFVLGLKKLRQNRDARIFLLLWLALPVLGAFTVATTTTFHVYNTRYVAMSFPAYILILATGIAGVRRPGIQFALLSSVLIVNGISLANYYFDSEYAREDARSAARYLETMARPGDIILAVGNPTALQYYYNADLPVVLVAGQAEKNPSLVADKLLEVSKNHDRMWLVEIRPWETDPDGEVKTKLDELARLYDHKSFPGVQIYSYRPTDRGS